MHLRIILGLIGIWALTTVILGVFNLQIYFPFNIGSAQEIPYHRWQTVRFTTFLTIAYFIFRFIFGFRPVSALVVLNMFFKILLVIGIINFYIADKLFSEWGVLIFFLFISMFSHRAAKSHRDKIFTKEC